MKKNIYISLLLLITLVLLVGCGNNNKELHDIVKFHYSKSYGLEGYIDYTISKNDDIVKFEKEGLIYNNKTSTHEYVNNELEIDKSVLLDIENIINEHKIYTWNGFSKRNNSIMDGSGFKLIVDYFDGSKIKAEGYMKYPKNYDEGDKALSDYLFTIK